MRRKRRGWRIRKVLRKKRIVQKILKRFEQNFDYSV